MKLSQIKSLLETLETVNFELQNGEQVPNHFHVTEVGKVTKHFIDCGGTERKEVVANFQLWNANDYEHRLKPLKLLNIITLAQEKLGIDDLEIEVEYQTNTIGKYDLEFKNKTFILTNKSTACLALEECFIPNISNQNATCTPGGGCC